LSLIAFVLFLEMCCFLTELFYDALTMVISRKHRQLATYPEFHLPGQFCRHAPTGRSKETTFVRLPRLKGCSFLLFIFW
jgi:hypothetical protein